MTNLNHKTGMWTLLSVLCAAVGAVCLTALSSQFAHFASSIPSTESDKSIAPARLAAQGGRMPATIIPRGEPLKVPPLPGLESEVSEQDLAVALSAALPWWNPPPVPSVFHELKLWGRNAVFTKEMLGTERTGEWLLQTVLNDHYCRTRTAPLGAGSYLLDSPFGIRVVAAGTEGPNNYRGEAHFGQLLKLLAEVGVPSSCSVTTSSGRVGDVRDLYQDAVMRFSYTSELEFIACSLAYWHPQTAWKDQFGNDYDFNGLLAALIAQPLGKGSCGGCHVPYAVVILLRVDEQHPILSREARAKACKWLLTIQHLLETTWSANGGWDTTWTNNSQIRFLSGDDQLDRITITGHHLEWMALAPADLRPSPTIIKRAVAGLRRDIESLPQLRFQSFKTLLPMTHAARALALLRGQDPYTVWAKYWQSGQLKRGPQGYTLKIDQHVSGDAK